ncbi:MAG: hypothetical protein ACTSYO_03190 [Candidatus Ranarchaeia archaeon]
MDWRYASKFLFLHTLDVVLIISSFYGVSTTVTQILYAYSIVEFFTDIQLIVSVLLYGGLLCLFLIPIQMGVGFVAFFKYKPPPFLLSVYFQYDQKELPDPLLDPLKSRVGIVVLIALLAGGYIAWPLYAIYGLYIIISLFMAIPVYSPEAMIVFIEGLAFAMSIPLIGLFIFLLIGVLAVEKRHHSP